jgi:glucose uptake protein GlcU
MSILMAAKVVISGFALIYLVLIGAYMIVFSENEERVKAQRYQFTYALIGFLFLNVPGVVYTVFFGDVAGESELGRGIV